jgi:hypothetical protein
MLLLWNKRRVWLPVLSLKNISNRGLSNSIFFGQRSIGMTTFCVFLSNLANLLIGKNSSTMAILTYLGKIQIPIQSSLCPSISRVVEFCSEKQMVWVNASSNVARMKNAKAFRDWPLVQNVRQAMHLPMLSINKSVPVSFAAITDRSPPNLTISDLCCPVKKHHLEFYFVHIRRVYAELMFFGRDLLMG